MGDPVFHEMATFSGACGDGDGCLVACLTSLQHASVSQSAQTILRAATLR